MKKSFFSWAILLASCSSYAQNTFPWPSSGNIGIGTFSPVATLDVNGNGNYSSALQIGGAGVNSNTTKLFINNGGGYGKNWALSSGANMISEQGFYIYNWTDSPTNPLFTISNGGYVGIGTTSPSSIFHLSNGGPSIILDANSQGTDFKRTYIATSEVATRDFVIGTRYDNNTVKSRNLYINNAGNVGIGTTNPRSKFDVNGAISVTNETGLPSSGKGIELTFQTSTDNDRLIAYDRTNSLYKTFNLNDNLYVNGNAGRVGIGTSSPDEKLTVKGKIHSQEVIVDAMTTVPDYVLEPDYKLTSLEEIKAYVDKNHHLPEIPSAKEIEKNGIKVGDMNMRLLKKIEELTLYLIEQQKQIEDLKALVTTNLKQ